MKKKKWSKLEQAIFLKRIGRLLSKGYYLIQAFEFLLLQEKKDKQEDIKKCMNKLKEGSSLYKVFETMSFHKDILGYLYYAEKYGDIAKALEKAGNLLQERQKQQDTLKEILKYPLFLLIFLSILLLFFNWILLPQFQNLFQSFHSQSSSTINGLFFIISMFPFYLYTSFILIILSSIYYVFYYKKLSPKNQMKLKLKIPYVRKIVKMLNSHYFSHQLGTLIQSGLSIFDSFSFIRDQEYNLFFKDEAIKIQQELKKGISLEEIIKIKSYYDENLSYIIAHGVANGTLGKEMSDYSDYVLEKLSHLVKSGINKIQPVIYSTIAVVVVVIYIAMLMPMFEMISLI